MAHIRHALMSTPSLALHPPRRSKHDLNFSFADTLIFRQQGAGCPLLSTFFMLSMLDDAAGVGQNNVGKGTVPLKQH